MLLHVDVLAVLQLHHSAALNAFDRNVNARSDSKETTRTAREQENCQSIVSAGRKDGLA